MPAVATVPEPVTGSIFARLEPLLPSVSKPIQYVGGELNSTSRTGTAPPRAADGALGADVPRRLRGRAAQPGRADPLRGAQRARLDPRRAHLLGVARHGGGDARGSTAHPAVHRRRPPAGPRLRRVRAVSFSTELGYTNMLNALDLAGIPLHAADRTDDDPIVLAGGHAAFNPEPIADFIDAAVLGDGEEVVLAISEVVREWKDEGRPGRSARRDELLRRLAVQRRRLRPAVLRRDLRRRRPHRGRSCPNRAGHPAPGPQAHPDGPRRLALPGQAAGAAGRDRPRALLGGDLPRLHPRLPVLPGRDDHPPGARALDRRPSAPWSRTASAQSGFEEVGLLSLSSADHTEIGEVAKGLADRYEGSNVSLSLPSHPGRRLQHHPGQRVLPQRPPLGADLRPRGRLASGCAR